MFKLIEKGFWTFITCIILYVVVGSLLLETDKHDGVFASTKEAVIFPATETQPQPVETTVEEPRCVEICLEAITPPMEKLPPPVDRKLLMEVIREQESNHNSRAIGDNGKAYGCMQIHNCVILDVNRHFGTNYKHADVYNNSTLSKKICQMYWQIYASPNASYEELARLWNGGPNWRNDPDTVTYWKQVKKRLNNRKHSLAV